jgi:hypothetical protein
MLVLYSSFRSVKMLISLLLLGPSNRIHSFKGFLLMRVFISFGATAPIWALAYLHETFRFTSVY